MCSMFDSSQSPLLTDMLQDRFMIQAGPKNQNELIRMEYERKKTEW